MKIFANKNIWKKLAVIILFVTLFTFMMPGQVHATSDSTSIGGALMKPICNLLLTICDGVVNLIHKYVMSQDGSTIRIDLESTWLDKLWTVVRVIISVAVVALVIVSGIASGRYFICDFRDNSKCNWFWRYDIYICELFGEFCMASIGAG